MDQAKQNHRSVFDALSDKLRELGLLYYPDENIFPLKFLMSNLEQHNFDFYQSGQSYERGWLFTVLKDIKVPFHVQFSILHELFETKLSPWTSNKALVFLIEEIYVLLRDWILSTAHPQLRTTIDSFPAHLIDEAISKYLVTISSETRQLSANLHQLQSLVRQHF
jgi:hypothetical protein